MIKNFARIHRQALIPTSRHVHASRRRTEGCYVQGTELREHGVQDAALTPRSAYVHLPFCKRRCYYCDFPVHVLGSRESASTQQTVSSYVELLCREIEQTARGEEQRPLETVSFGGGTPSLIPPHELNVIVEVLRRRFGMARDVEMSMEADPGTFDGEKLREFLALGVNRISLGIQAFDDNTLRLCGRSHTLEDVWQAIRDIQSSCVSSWSLDLISGLPHVSLESWQKTLETAVACRPDHVSIYDLQIEERTLFSRWYEAEMSPLPSHELSAEMYILASELLRNAGYEHYEISNYARDGHRSRHNMTYWTRQPFYGFGMGATSYIAGRRMSRPKKIKTYAEWVRSMDTMILPESYTDEKESVLETVMLQLRLKDGIAFNAFHEEYGEGAEQQLKQAIQRYCTSGMVECLDRDSRVIDWKGSWDEAVRIRLKDPDGLLLSNEILSTIFCRFE